MPDDPLHLMSHDSHLTLIVSNPSSSRRSRITRMSSNLSAYGVPRLRPRVNYSTQLIFLNTSYTTACPQSAALPPSESDILPVLSNTSPTQRNGPESQPFLLKSIPMDPISLPRDHHTTFNHALDFHAAMHPICPGAPHLAHHHHDAIGGPAVHCASDQHTSCNVVLCGITPAAAPSLSRPPWQRHSDCCASRLRSSLFTMGRGGDPVLIFATSVSYHSTIHLAFILSRCLL